MITIRFSRTLPQYQYPLVLRFGDDGTVEPPLPLPIRDGLIGIESAAKWANAPKREQQLLLVGASHKVGIKQSINWNTPTAVTYHNSVNWKVSPKSFVSLAIINWQTPAMQANTINIAWALPDLLSIKSNIEWQAPQQQQTEFSYPWLTNPKAFEHKRDINWIDSELINQRIISRFNSFQYRINDHSIKWGPHKAEWICSTRYRPPENGKVKLRFSEPFNTSTSPIQLRFTPSPTHCYFDDGGGLVDSNPILPPIDFKLPIAPQLRRVYMTKPTVECIRVSDDTRIAISRVNLSVSRGQFACSVNIDFQSRIDAQRAENQLLKISINGYDFYAMCEQCNRNRAFAQDSHSGNGRSRVAELATPHQLPISYTNSASRSLGGLMSDILQYTDWSVDVSNISDFTVPAGAYSVANVSPIEALNNIAEQLGCMLQCNDENKSILVLPRYPTVPWAIGDATPDVAIHQAVILSHSEQDHVSKLCNSCWVRGEQQGVSAKIKRTGTAGDIAAGDISQQLIVDPQAARLAGTNAIAETGKKRIHNITLPVLADLPPLKVGMLCGVNNGDIFKGTIDSWSISAGIDGSGAIDVEQQITVIQSLE